MDEDIHIFCLTVTYKNGLVKVIIGKIKKKYQLIDIQEIKIYSLCNHCDFKRKKQIYFRRWLLHNTYFLLIFLLQVGPERLKRMIPIQQTMA